MGDGTEGLGGERGAPARSRPSTRESRAGGPAPRPTEGPEEPGAAPRRAHLVEGEREGQADEAVEEEKRGGRIQGAERHGCRREEKRSDTKYEKERRTKAAEAAPALQLPRPRQHRPPGSAAPALMNPSHHRTPLLQSERFPQFPRNLGRLHPCALPTRAVPLTPRSFRAAQSSRVPPARPPARPGRPGTARVPAAASPARPSQGCARGSPVPPPRQRQRGPAGTEPGNGATSRPAPRSGPGDSGFGDSHVSRPQLRSEPEPSRFPQPDHAALCEGQLA